MFWQRTSRIWILEHHEVIPSHKRICLQLDMGLVVGTVKSSLADLLWTKALVHPIQSQQHKYESELKRCMTVKHKMGKQNVHTSFPLCLSICLFVYLSVYLSVYLYVYLSFPLRTSSPVTSEWGHYNSSIHILYPCNYILYKNIVIYVSCIFMYII